MRTLFWPAMAPIPVMQLFVKIDKTIIVDVEPDSLIGDVVQQISNKTGYRPDTFYLKHNCKNLEITKSLQDYNIGKNSTIHLGFRIDLNSMTICVKYLKDKTISLKVKSFDSIKDVKNTISTIIGYRPDQLQLFLGDKQLIDEALIYSCGMKIDSKLYLVFTFIPLSVEINATGKQVKFDFEKTETIASVKRKIIAREGPLNILRLVCKGITLKDTQILSSYNVDHKSTLVVIQLIEQDVSHFTNQELDNFLNNFLGLEGIEDFEERSPYLALYEKATRSNAFADGDDYTDEEIKIKENNGVLSNEHLAILNDLCCFAMECGEAASKLRIKLTDKMFNLLFDNDLELLRNLKRLSINESMVLISIKDTYISFDIDDYDQDKNVHISLNTPDSGGVMLFFMNDAVVPILPRTGSLTTYNPTILCGSTKVQGIQNSLLLVNEASRWFMREDEYRVIEVDQALIDKYNSRKETLSLKLLLYLREKKDLKDRILRADREGQESKKRIRDLQAETVLLRGEDANTSNMNLEQLDHAKRRAKSRLDDIENREQDLLRTSEIEKMCVICKTEPKTIVLLPCRHFALCKACSRNDLVDSCPLCRENIDSKIELFV